jgi:predicted enzyme related to lactoylglutathione lyase
MPYTGLKFMVEVVDMKRAIAFYTGAFDIPVCEQSDDWTELGVPGATLGLHAGRTGEGVTHTGLSVTVDDIDAAAKAVEAAGGKVIQVGPDLGGFRLAEFVDTENNYFMASGPA